MFFVNAATYLALRADVHQFGREAIGDVHHGCGLYAYLVQPLDDVFAGFGLELALQQVFLAGEVGLYVLVGTFQYGLLALQQLETHIGRTQISAPLR